MPPRLPRPPRRPSFLRAIPDRCSGRFVLLSLRCHADLARFLPCPRRLSGSSHLRRYPRHFPFFYSVQLMRIPARGFTQVTLLNRKDDLPQSLRRLVDDRFLVGLPGPLAPEVMNSPDPTALRSQKQRPSLLILVQVFLYVVGPRRYSEENSKVSAAASRAPAAVFRPYPCPPQESPCF